MRVFDQMRLTDELHARVVASPMGALRLEIYPVNPGVYWRQHTHLDLTMREFDLLADLVNRNRTP